MGLQLPITERDFEDARPYKTQTVTCNQKRKRKQKKKAKEIEAQKRRIAEASMTKQVSKSTEIKTHDANAVSPLSEGDGRVRTIQKAYRSLSLHRDTWMKASQKPHDELGKSQMKRRISACRTRRRTGNRER